jgi:PRTRC genetic system ThiF family protein
MKYHQINNYLLDPPHKVTVALIGCGGTGSQVLSILARMNLSMVALGHPGFHVVAYDDDKISDANIGRQLYSSSEVGSYKSVSLITRFNRFYGTNWQSKPYKYNTDEPVCERNYNIYITCVDDFKTRLRLAKFFKQSSHSTHSTEKLYWLDFGNTNNTGQAILGTLFKQEQNEDEEVVVNEDNVPHLPCFDEWASLYAPPKPSENTPSCSLAEALEKQDLLINSSLANAGMQLLWRLFREGKTPYSGVIINLDSLTSNPIRV